MSGGDSAEVEDLTFIELCSYKAIVTSVTLGAEVGEIVELAS